MAKPISPDLVYEIASVSEPSLSSEGNLLAYVRSQVNAETQKGESRVMLSRLPNRISEEFTAGPRDASPSFSPDGRSLAFLRSDDEDVRALWIIPTDGGEAWQLTSGRGGVSEFVWSPDSTRIAYASNVDPDRPPEDHDPSKDPKTRVVSRIRYRFDTLGWKGDAHSHLFVVNAATSQSRQVTDGDWDDGFVRWSPDGTRLAFVSGRAADRDTRAGSEAYVVAADGGEPELRSAGLLNVVSVSWAPDSRRLLALGSKDPDNMGHWQGRLYVLEPDGDPVELTGDSLSPVGGFPGLGTPPEIRWTEDERIVLIADRRGTSCLFELHASSGAVRSVRDAGGQLNSLALDHEALTAAVVASTPSSPGELHFIDLTSDSGLTKLTGVNDDYLAEHPPGKMDKFLMEREGLDIESRLFLPPGFDETQSYALVLDIHGGPHGVFYDAFNPIQQVLASAGYIVLAVNPRGSSTYGENFMKAVIRDWGGEDYLDIMAAVDKAAGLPYVDASRMGVTGYSYGGFMTAWIIGHDQRFKAAVSGAPCINLSSMYGTSDVGISFGEVQWGGLRKDALDMYLSMSPLTYAPSVETPLLLLHGEDDHRCPIGQSEEYFVTLKRLGKEVEFVRFPGCGHSFLRSGHPKLRREYLARVRDWFDRYLTVPSAASAESGR